MPAFGSITYNDYDGQSGIVGFNVSPVGFVAYDTLEDNLEALGNAIDAVTLGIKIKDELSFARRYNGSNVRSAEENAQRGNKWFVSMTDAQVWLDTPANTIPNPGYQKPVNMEIPTADLSLRFGNSDVVWSMGSSTNTAEFDTLQGAIESLVLSAYGGFVEVQRIEAVTRSGG